MKYIYEIIHICIAVVDESEEWSSQYIFQFKQLESKSPENIRASAGVEPVTSAIPLRCSTNWALKPHNGGEVNLLSSYLPMSSLQIIFFYKPVVCQARDKVLPDIQSVRSDKNIFPHLFRGMPVAYHGKKRVDLWAQIAKRTNKIAWNVYRFVYRFMFDLHYVIGL